MKLAFTGRLVVLSEADKRIEPRAPVVLLGGATGGIGVVSVELSGIRKIWCTPFAKVKSRLLFSVIPRAVALTRYRPSGSENCLLLVLFAESTISPVDCLILKSAFSGARVFWSEADSLKL